MISPSSDSMRVAIARWCLPIFAAGMVIFAAGLWLPRLTRNDPEPALSDAELNYSIQAIAALDLLAQHLESLHPLLVAADLGSPQWRSEVEVEADGITAAAQSLMGLEAPGEYAQAHQHMVAAARLYLDAMDSLHDATRLQDRTKLREAIESMNHGSIELGRARALSE